MIEQRTVRIRMTEGMIQAQAFSLYELADSDPAAPGIVLRLSTYDPQGEIQKQDILFSPELVDDLKRGLSLLSDTAD